MEGLLIDVAKSHLDDLQKLVTRYKLRRAVEI